MAKRRKRLSASERRSQLIAVGRSVFAKRGYEAPSVEELASAAGVSKPILYEHFGGKEGLYAVIVDREIEAVVTAITRSIASGSARERVEQSFVAFFTYVRDEPDGFAVLCHDSPVAISGGGLSSLLGVVAERVSDVFLMMFTQAGFSQVHAPIYAQAVMGMVAFVGQWWTEEKSVPMDDVVDHLCAFVWMGLRHLPDEPAPVPKPDQTS